MKSSHTDWEEPVCGRLAALVVLLVPRSERAFVPLDEHSNFGITWSCCTVGPRLTAVTEGRRTKNRHELLCVEFR